MNAKRVVLAALSGMLAVCAAAREPDVSGLRAWTYPAYTVVTHDPEAVGWIAQRTPLVDQLLAQLLEIERRPTTTPTYIYVVRKSLWDNYLQVTPNVNAQHVATRFANYLLIGGSRDRSAVTGAVARQYTHNFLLTQLHGGFPMWFDEGLATVVAFTQVRLGTVRVENPYFGKHMSRRLPMERLLRLDRSSPEIGSLPTLIGFHEQSWAMVHKGLIDDPQFRSRMFAYLKAIDDGMPVDQAVPEYFKMSMPELDEEIFRYLHQPEFAHAEFSYQPRPVALEPGRKLAEGEALEMIATVMLNTGVNAARVTEVLDAAQKHTPDAAGVLVLRMRVAARARDDAALNRYLQALGNETQHAATARGAGLALFERVRDEQACKCLSPAQRDLLTTQALEMLDRSLTANPDDPEAAWGFGVLSTRLKRDPEVALRRLKRASELMPENAALARATYEVIEANEPTGQTIPLLNRIAAFTNSPTERQWAKQQIAAAKAGQEILQKD